MSTLQLFSRTDLDEPKWRDSWLPILAAIDFDLQEFYDNAFYSWLLGGILWDEKRSPLATVINRDAFVQAFGAIHNALNNPGTFEYYLEIFRVIWGNDVEVDFEVPAPGKLLINIEAQSVALYNFVARNIVDNVYVFDEVVTDEGDNIVFQTEIGVKTQSEVDALMRELKPTHIWTEATLSLV